jgi:hypothetical protein
MMARNRQNSTNCQGVPMECENNSGLKKKKKEIDCSQCEEEFNRSYFEQLYSEYTILTENDKAHNPSAVQAMEKIIEKSRKMGCPTCDDVYAMEKALIQLQSIEKIRLERNAYRDKYREICTSERYSNYLAEASRLEESAKNADAEKIREVILSDVDFLLSEIHLKYTLLPYKETKREPIVENILKGILIYLLFIFVVGVASFVGGRVYWGMIVLLLVMVAGALGAFLSLIRRMNEVPIFNDPVVGFLSLKYGKYSIYISPLSGAISALVLFFIFIGGLVNGNLFPTVECNGNLLVIPPLEGCENYGKLFVWSFIAGFAERFVPDILDRLTTQKKNESINHNPQGYYQSMTPPPTRGRQPKVETPESQSDQEGKKA